MTGSARLRRWGYRSWVSEAAEDGAEIGRIARVDRGQCDVVTAEGLVRVWSDSVRSQLETAPVTGDWVELVGNGIGSVKSGGGDLGAGTSFSVDGMKMIGRVLPRKTALSRRDPAEREREQVLAANVDVVGIVAGLDRPLPPGRFERLLIMALDSGASILVLLTKSDRSRKATVLAETVGSIVGDVPIVVTSAFTGDGLDGVISHLGSGRMLALVGASGSGKSALVNALAEADVVATKAVRAKDARGRHTTVARQLVLLPGEAGLILDTPGIRSIGLWDCEEALERVYGDIAEAAADCRFADCRHATEPRCAVQGAIQRGEMSAQRLERARALHLELEVQRDRVARRGRRADRPGRRRRR